MSLQLSELSDADSDDQEYLWTLNFGPQHPATHTTLRLILKLDGETIVGAVPDIGYLHSGFEKLGEDLDFNQYVTIVDRMNYISPVANELSWIQTVEKLVGVLKQVGLEQLSPDLDKVDLWAQRLSGGEQQRLAIARVLLAEPSVIFLDEATASLDEAGQEMLYRLLRDLPWHPTIISVGHRATLHQFHDRVFELTAAARAATQSPT